MVETRKVSLKGPQVFSPKNVIPSEEQSSDPTPEIVDYLTSLLVSRRQLIPQAVLDKDHQMPRRMGQYDKALQQYLGADPKVLALGDDMRKREMWMEVNSQGYKTEIDSLDEQSLLLQIRQEKLGMDIHKLQEKISGIGRNRLMPGDLSRLLGRMQVELGALKTKGRLSFWGKLAEKLIGSKESHPALEPKQKELTEVESELAQLGTRKEDSAKKHFNEEKDQKRRLENDQEAFFHQIDDWVLTQSLDYLLVHHLYYQRPPLDRYLKSHHLADSDLNIFEQHGLLQRGKQPKKQSKDTLETLTDGETDLPMPIKIGGEIFTDLDSAWKAFSKLNPRIPQRKMRHFFNRSLMALRYEKQGSHHPDGRVFAADDPIIAKVGGNYRLRIGRYRLIYNLDNMEDEQRVPELVTILQHDDPNYQ